MPTGLYRHSVVIHSGTLLHRVAHVTGDLIIDEVANAEIRHSVGAFGLGNPSIAALRGAHAPENSPDARLDGSKRRTIWFEPLMETMLKYLQRQASRTRIYTLMESADATRDRYGDHFEEQGRRWEDGVAADGEMGGYFALKVAAVSGCLTHRQASPLTSKR